MESVGELVGAILGEFVGKLVAAFVGEFLGAFVGKYVGALVGKLVGDLVCVIVDALFATRHLSSIISNSYCLVNVQLSFTRRSLADVIMFVFIRARFIVIAIFGHCVTRFEPLHCRSRSICPRG